MKNTINSGGNSGGNSESKAILSSFFCLCVFSKLINCVKFNCVFNINENSYDNQLYHNLAALLLPQEQDS